MSVAEQLGLEGPARTDLLERAEERWQDWGGTTPALAAVGGVAGLRDWLRHADAATTDEVLYGLGRLAASDGGDDPAAAGVLAWALLPGACALAARLRTLSARIDEVVAAQLWIEVRSFRLRRPHKVAANLVANTRTGVLAACGEQTRLRRLDRTWAHTAVVDPASPLWAELAEHDDSQDSASEELAEVLDWACETEVISPSDRALLLCLVAAAQDSVATRMGRGQGGLMANDVSVRVAAQWGVSPQTVRRRAGASVAALARACRHAPVPAWEETTGAG